LIVAAPWVGEDKGAAVKYFVEQIKSRLGDQGLLSLSRIILADPQDAAVQALNRTIPVERGSVEIRDRPFSGQFIKQGYIITSKQPPSPAAA